MPPNSAQLCEYQCGHTVAVPHNPAVGAGVAWLSATANLRKMFGWGRLSSALLGSSKALLAVCRAGCSMQLGWHRLLLAVSLPPWQPKLPSVLMQ